MNAPLLSARELADLVEQWCVDHGVCRLNGQVGERLTERSVRYYRALGLVDAGTAGSAGGFGERQRLQLIAIRLLQAQGLPLRRIRELLDGRSTGDLHEIQRRGLAENQRAVRHLHTPIIWPATPEQWQAQPIDTDHLLLTRAGRVPSADQIAKVRVILAHDPERLATPDEN